MLIGHEKLTSAPKLGPMLWPAAMWTGNSGLVGNRGNVGSLNDVWFSCRRDLQPQDRSIFPVWLVARAVLLCPQLLNGILGGIVAITGP